MGQNPSAQFLCTRWTGPPLSPRPRGGSWEVCFLSLKLHHSSYTTLFLYSAPPFLEATITTLPQTHPHQKPLWQTLPGCFHLLINSLMMCGPKYFTTLNQPGILKSKRHLSSSKKFQGKKNKRRSFSPPFHSWQSMRSFPLTLKRHLIFYFWSDIFVVSLSS